MSTTSTPITVSASINNARVDADALEFARQRNLIEYMNVAVELAVRHFMPIEPIWVELMLDPEGDWDKLVLNVVVVGTVENVRERDKAYGNELIASMPSDKWLQISLTPDIGSTNERT